MTSITSIGLQGIQQGQRASVESAQRITRAFTPDSNEDPVKPMIDLANSKRQVEASAKVVKVGDSMMKSVLDIIG